MESDRIGSIPFLQDWPDGDGDGDGDAGQTSWTMSGMDMDTLWMLVCDGDNAHCSLDNNAIPGSIHPAGKTPWYDHDG